MPISTSAGSGATGIGSIVLDSTVLAALRVLEVAFDGSVLLAWVVSR